MICGALGKASGSGSISGSRPAIPPPDGLTLVSPHSEVAASPGTARPDSRAPSVLDDAGGGPGAGRATLLVRAPPTYERERRYVLDVVLNEWLGLDYRLAPGDQPTVSISLQGDEDGAVLDLPDILFARPEPEWLTVGVDANHPARAARVAPWSADFPDDAGARFADPTSIPILFAEPGAHGEMFRRSEAGIRFAADVFGSVFYMLTRYEEVARRVRDDYDRYPGWGVSRSDRRLRGTADRRRVCQCALGGDARRVAVAEATYDPIPTPAHARCRHAVGGTRTADLRGPAQPGGRCHPSARCGACLGPGQVVCGC